MTSVDMLRFLTQKLKSQTLTEVKPYQPELDDDRDSGTESDDENAELEQFGDEVDERNRHDTSSYGSASPLNHPPSPTQDGASIQQSDAGTRTHEISEHNFDTISCTSDYERQSLDFDRHSSEDELGTINKENVAEKRKWSQIHRAGYCDSAGSSDDEVKEYLLHPQPLRFSSCYTPGKWAKKIHTPSPKLILPRVAPLSVSTTVSPRKRHRQNTTSDNESDSVIQRPCLDFEKMQQKTLVKKHYSHSLGRARIVKIRTVTNGGTRAPKGVFDPAIFSFRSISSAYSPLTPVEDPSCAY